MFAAFQVLPLVPRINLDPESMALLEGVTNATYSVVLNAQPTAGVTLTITSTNPDVTTTQTTLTFTTSNWDSAQTVTVMVAEDTDLMDDTATLTHTAAGGNYDSVAVATLTVTVRDNDAPLVIPAPDDQAYSVGQSILATLPQATGGVAPLTYTLTPTASIPAGLSFDAGTRLLSGPLTSTTAVTLTYRVTDSATPTPATISQTFTLTISAIPAIESIPNQIYSVRESVALTLPESGGAAPLSYTLTRLDGASPTLPPGLTFNPDFSERTIGGMPSMVFATTSLVYAVTDALTLTASQTFTLAVTAAVPLAPSGVSAVAGDSRITANWTAVLVADNGDNAITAYTATAAEGANTFTCTATGAAATSCTITDLTGGLEYRVTVKATNAIGSSAASAAAMATPVFLATTGAFTEAAANDGRVEGALTFTLAGDTFVADLITANRVSAGTVPPGLTPVFVRTSDTVVTMTLADMATSHTEVNDDDTFSVTFTAAAFTTGPTPNGANYTGGAIDFNDPDGTPTLTIANIAVGEGAGVATVSVTVSHAVAGGFSVDVSTMDTTTAGSATAGEDYIAVNSQTLSFTGANNNETRTFTITIKEDLAAEGPETLTLSLDNLQDTGVFVNSRATATVTITDNDTAVLTLVGTASIESFSSVTSFIAVTATLLGTVPGGFTVVLATADGTATADEDYTAISPTLTFVGDAGESQDARIPVLADTVPEREETIMLSFRDLDGTPADVDIRATATGIITLSDGGIVGFGDAVIADQVYVADTTIAPLLLPEPIAADIGRGFLLEYTLTPTSAIPAGLSFDAATHTLSGMIMPTATGATLTYTASNFILFNGDRVTSAPTFRSTSASLTFSITVAETGVASVRHYSDAAATTPITDLVSGGEIYSVVVFGADVRNENATDTNARPAIASTLGANTPVQFGIVAHGAGLENGNCQATDTTDTNRYICRYSVAGSGANAAVNDPGLYSVSVSAATTDKASGMALAAYDTDAGVMIGVRPSVESVTFYSDRAATTAISQAVVGSAIYAVIRFSENVQNINGLNGQQPTIVVARPADFIPGMEAQNRYSIVAYDAELSDTHCRATSDTATNEYLCLIETALIRDYIRVEVGQDTHDLAGYMLDDSYEPQNFDLVAHPRPVVTSITHYADVERTTAISDAVSGGDIYSVIQFTSLAIGEHDLDIFYALGSAEPVPFNLSFASITRFATVSPPSGSCFRLVVGSGLNPQIRCRYEVGAADDDPYKVIVGADTMDFQGQLLNPDGSVEDSGVIISALRFVTGAAIADQVYAVGQTVALTLPEGVAGVDALTYTLTPASAIPAGLTFDAATRSIKDAPTAESDAVTLTYTVTDSAAMPTSLSLTFRLTISNTRVLSIANIVVGEGVGMATVTVSLDNVVPGGFMVDATTLGGTATAGADYTAVIGHTLTFAGEAGETQTFSVTIVDDALSEGGSGSETVTLWLDNLQGNSVPVDISNTATLTITDDDRGLAVTSVGYFADEAATLPTTQVAIGTHLYMVIRFNEHVRNANSDVAAGVSGRPEIKVAHRFFGTPRVVLPPIIAYDTAFTGNLNACRAQNAGDNNEYLCRFFAENVAVSLGRVHVEIDADGAHDIAGNTLAMDYVDEDSVVNVVDPLDRPDVMSIAHYSDADRPQSAIISDTDTVRDGTIYSVIQFSGLPIASSEFFYQIGPAAADRMPFGVHATDGTPQNKTCALLDGGTGLAAANQSFWCRYNPISGDSGTYQVIVGTDTTDTAGLTLDGDSTSDTGVTLAVVTGTATLSIAAVSVDEADGTATVSVTVDAEVTDGFSVDAMTADGTATAPGDYTAVSGQTLSFAGTFVGETQTFTVTILDDPIYEGGTSGVPETVAVSLGNLQNNATDVDISSAAATISITDNDYEVALTMEDVSVSEGVGSTATVIVSVDTRVPGAFSVEASTADGTATAPGDYDAVSDHVLSFTGEANETQTFSVPITNDNTREFPETLTVSLSNLQVTTDTATTMGTLRPVSATITIMDDDVSTGGINLNLRFPVTINGKTYFYLDNNGNGIADVGDAVTHRILNDLLNGGSPTDATLDGAHNGQDDARSVIVGDTAVILPTLNELMALRSDLAITTAPVSWWQQPLLLSGYWTSTRSTTGHSHYRFSDEVVSDRHDSNSNQVAFQVRTLPTFSVGIADQTYTVGQPVAVALTLPEAAGGVGTLTYTLTRDDDPSVLPAGLSFDPMARTISGRPSESFGDTAGASLRYTATDATGAARDILFVLRVAAAPALVAIADQTYTATTAVNLTLPVSTTGATPLTYTLTPSASIPDGLTFDAAMRTLTGTPTTATAAGTLTYAVTDANGVTTSQTFMVTVNAMLSIANVEVGEGDGTAIVTVSVDIMVPGGFSVDISTMDDTAIADEDYTAVIRQTLAFTGETAETHTVSIAITNDKAVEGPETLTLLLTDLDGTTAPVVIGNPAMVTITDDDTAVLTILSTSSGESTSSLALDIFVSVILGDAVPGGFTVLFETADDTATAGEDYTAVSRTLTFEGTADELHRVSIPVLPDDVPERAESFTVSLRDLDNTQADVDISATATPTIRVSDGGIVGFGDAVIADQVYVANTIITPLTLPEPIAADFTGTPFYTLTPASTIPPGLSFDAATHTLSDMPTTTTTTPVTLIYTASNSGTSASLTFSITVVAIGVGSVTHYSDAAAATPITDLVSSGEIYSVVVFGANVSNENATDTTARPAIAYTLGNDTPVQFGIVAHDAVLANGNCRAALATDTSRYTCHYSVADSGPNVAANDPGAYTLSVLDVTTDEATSMALDAYDADAGVTIGVRPELRSVTYYADSEATMELTENAVIGSAVYAVLEFSENMDNINGVAGSLDMDGLPTLGVWTANPIGFNGESLVSHVILAHNARLRHDTCQAESAEVTSRYLCRTNLALAQDYVRFVVKQDARDLAGNTLAMEVQTDNFPLINPLPPEVRSIMHYADSARTKPIRDGDVVSGGDIYSVIQFSGLTVPGSSLEVFYKLGSAMRMPFGINLTTQEDRTCNRPGDGGSNPFLDPQWQCRYSVGAADDGLYQVIVGAGTQDTLGQPLGADSTVDSGVTISALRFAAGADIAEQIYTVGTAITLLTLPPAIGGTGVLTYTLTPTASIPEGLTFDATARTLADVPTMVTAAVTLTYTATDANDVAATLTFTVAVVDRPAVTITSGTTGTANSADGALTFTLSFSESVTDFEPGDIAVTGGDLLSITPSPVATNTYTQTDIFTLLATPDANTNGGMLTVTVRADAATAGGGSKTPEATATSAYDTLAPDAPTFQNVGVPAGHIDAVDEANGLLIAGINQADTRVILCLAGGSGDECGGTGSGRTTRTTNALPGTSTIRNWSYMLTTADISAMDEGDETLTATAIDTNGNPSDETAVRITVDTIAPDPPTFNLPAAGDIINIAERDTGVTIGGDVENGASVSVCLGAASLTDAPCTGGTTITTPDGVTVTDTTWRYTLSVAEVDAMGQGDEFLLATTIDPAGNRSALGSTTINVDTTVPAFTSGLTGAVAVGATSATVTAYDATATDNSGITYTLGGPNADRFSIVPDTGIVTYNDDQNVEAIHTIVITATDTAGNSATQDVTISVLNAPAVTITSSTPIGDYANGVITFTISFSSEAVTGFEPTGDVSVAGGTGGVITPTPVAATSYMTTDTFTLAVTPLTDTNDGVLTVTVRADAVTGAVTLTGNPETSETRQYDTVAPIITAGANATAMFIVNDPVATEVYNADATDDGGTADTGITYSLGGANAGQFTINPATGSVTYQNSPTDAVVHTIDITATDKGGNTDTITVTVTAVLSTNSALSALTIVTSGGAAVPLTPAFATATSAYTASVRQEVTRVTFTLPTAHAGATAVITGTAADGTALTVTDSTATGSTATRATVSDLTEGISPNNTIIVTVTAADSTTMTVYTINLTRAPLLTFGTDANSAGITIDDQTYNIGETIPALTLPIATGGLGTLNYTLTPEADIPAGLIFAPATRILSGIPTAIVTRTLTYTVTDGATPPVSTELTFSVMIVRGVTVTPGSTADIRLDLDGNIAANDPEDGLLTLPAGHTVTEATIGAPPETAVANPPAGVLFSLTTDITLDMTLAAAATICLPSTGVPAGREPALYHYFTLAGQATATWNEIGRDTATREGYVCGETLTFSPFAIGYMTRVMGAARLNEQLLPRASLVMSASMLAAVAARVEAAADSTGGGGIGAGIGSIDGTGGIGGIGGTGGNSIGTTPTLAYQFGGQSSLHGLFESHGKAMLEGQMEYERLLEGASFVLPLSTTGDASADNAGDADRRAGAIVFWGNSDYHSLSNNQNGLDWSGPVLSAHLGMDGRINQHLLTGVALSWNRARFDYHDEADGADTNGEYQYRNVSFNPYFGWLPVEGLKLWGTFGYGRGEIQIDEDGSDEYSSDTTQSSLAGGFSHRLFAVTGHLDNVGLLSGGVITLKVKGDATLARVGVESSEEEDIAAQDVDSQRLRLLLAGEVRRGLANGGAIRHSLEIGMRYDGGDGETGSGLEVGSGLRYTNPIETLAVAGNVRTSLAQGYAEWGGGFTVQLSPRAGRGLSLSLHPVWGRTQSAAERLWRDGVDEVGNAAGDTALQRSVDTEIGYGVGASALGKAGVLTPYTGINVTEGTRRLRLGGRFAGDDGLRLSLEGAQEDTLDGVSHTVLLRGGVEF